MTVVEKELTAQRDPEPQPDPGLPAASGLAATGPAATGPAATGPAAWALVHSSGGPGAKERILATANELFYHEGIRAVGVDRLISESRVTKATFYKHFGAKETLVVSYIQARHEAVRDTLTDIVARTATTEAALHSMVDNVVDQAHSRDFRGCAFINAATEFPDSHHGVREVVSAHRDWYTAFIADLFRRLGHPMPGDAADEFVLLRDGTMSGGYASDPIAASAAMQRCVRRLLAEVTP